jgi:hypothetical protein
MKKNIILLAALVLAVPIFTGCVATDGPAPRTKWKTATLGVNSNGTPSIVIVGYENPKDLVIDFNATNKSFTLRSSNNPQVIDSAGNANAAYINALDQLIQHAFQAGGSAAGQFSGGVVK